MCYREKWIPKKPRGDLEYQLMLEAEIARLNKENINLKDQLNEASRNFLFSELMSFMSGLGEYTAFTIKMNSEDVDQYFKENKDRSIARCHILLGGKFPT